MGGETEVSKKKLGAIYKLEQFLVFNSTIKALEVLHLTELLDLSDARQKQLYPLGFEGSSRCRSNQGFRRKWLKCR